MKKILILIVAILAISIVFQGCEDSNKDTNSDYLIIELGNERFELDNDVEPMLKFLGDDYEFFEAPSCVYEGMDKVYEYKSISIYTYPLEDKDLIDEVIFTDNTYSTNKGIKVGDTIKEVKKTYGDNYKDTGNMLRYADDPNNLDSVSLMFTYDKKGIVKTINYYSASNIIE